MRGGHLLSEHCFNFILRGSTMYRRERRIEPLG